MPNSSSSRRSAAAFNVGLIWARMTAAGIRPARGEVILAVGATLQQQFVIGVEHQNREGAMELAVARCTFELARRHPCARSSSIDEDELLHGIALGGARPDLQQSGRWHNVRRSTVTSSCIRFGGMLRSAETMPLDHAPSLPKVSIAALSSTCRAACSSSVSTSDDGVPCLTNARRPAARSHRMTEDAASGHETEIDRAEPVVKGLRSVPAQSLPPGTGRQRLDRPHGLKTGRRAFARTSSSVRCACAHRSRA
jgi:hypothetical protein